MVIPVDVIFRAEEIGERDLSGCAVVALDILRATSVIVAAFQCGADAVYPVQEVDDARRLADRLRREGKQVLLGGERNALPPAGFDMGNSPREYTLDKVHGKTVVLTTTNGTRLLEGCAANAYTSPPGSIWIGSLHNRTALAEVLFAQNQPVILACAGTEGKVSLDDVCGAGAIIHALTKAGETELSDAALGALHIYLLHRSDLSKFFSHTFHGKRLIDTGLAEDLEFCTQIDTAHVVPRYCDGVIHNHLSGQTD